MAEDAAELGNRKGPHKIEKPVGEGNADRLFYAQNLDAKGREAQNPLLETKGHRLVIFNFPDSFCGIPSAARPFGMTLQLASGTPVRPVSGNR